MNINRIILTQFTEYVESIADQCLVGRCYECCQGFIRDFCLNDTVFSITKDNQELSINDKNNVICKIQIIKTACVFVDMTHFQEHSQLLYKSLRLMSDDTINEVNIPCTGMYGKKYNYYKCNIFTYANQHDYGVGFPHYVLHIARSNGENYILDPSITQFTHPPSSLIVGC
jgi:hypothetical protein